MIICHAGVGKASLQAPQFVRELVAADQRVAVVLDEKARLFVGPSAFLPEATVVENESSLPHNTQVEAVVYFAATSGIVSLVARGMSGGVSGDARPPVFVFPDLDPATASHPAIRENIGLIESDGVRVVVREEDGGFVSAEIAASVVLGGIGRVGGILAGMRLLVTAGGTHENIDSVRFIGNRSSGKMGLSIARNAHRMGAEVTVIAANIPNREPGVSWVPVESVEDMRREVMGSVGGMDAVVMAAAVSDFTPSSRLEGKIRRGDSETMTLGLQATADILGGIRGKGGAGEAGVEGNLDLFVVGFAATHGDPVSDAREKLGRKGADLIVGNDISQAGIGFSSDENEVYIVGRELEKFVPKAPKDVVARIILEVMGEEIENRKAEKYKRPIWEK